MRGKVLLILVMLLAVVAVAQEEDPCVEPTEKKIVKLLSEAQGARDAMDAHRKLKMSLESDPGCARCLYETGRSAFFRATESGVSMAAAERYFNRLVAICPDFEIDVPYYQGVIAYRKGDTKTAIEAFQRFEELPFTGSDKERKFYDKKLADVQAILPELTFKEDFFKNNGVLETRILKNVSTRDAEYLPMLSPDNEIIFFTRKSMYKAKGDIVGKEVELLTQAERANVHTEFNSGLALESPFNVGDNYGGVTLSVNNKEMFVCACKPFTSSYKDCSIYRTHFDLKFSPDNAKQQWVWSGLEELGPEINAVQEGTPMWEAQPSLSGDGQLLFFTRYVPAPDGNGGQHDIYYAKREGRTKWSTAVPLPPSINTKKDEKVPFMHSDSKTLYFASNGLQGAGGYDIFYTRLKEDGSWTTPKNMGNPVNSDKDETGLIVSADGRTAYFASNRLKGVGKHDIYSFTMPEEARPEEVLIVKGKVTDEAGKAVKDATIEIKYMDTREVETINVDEQDGGYAAVVKLEHAGDVLVTVKKEDHVFDSRAFTEEDAGKGGVVDADLELQKIEVGKNYRVNDINYATNSADITKASEYILENLIEFLKENATIKIAIHGHTDNVGGMDSNLALSKDRAATVMEYLLVQGIKADRLSFDGFGPTKPVASNETEAGKAKNRRTEFVIVSK